MPMPQFQTALFMYVNPEDENDTVTLPTNLYLVDMKQDELDEFLKNIVADVRDSISKAGLSENKVFRFAFAALVGAADESTEPENSTDLDLK